MGIGTRTLESIPGLTSPSRQFHEPQAEWNHRSCFRDAESTSRCQCVAAQARQWDHIGRSLTCPILGSFCHVTLGPHAQSTPTPLRNLALRSCSFPTRLRPRAAASTALSELTPSSIAACESQVNNEMIRSVIPGTVQQVHMATAKPCRERTAPEDPFAIPM